METGIELIAEERQKQIEKHGFTGEHHANHPEWYAEGQLISAARMLSVYDPNDGLTRLFKQTVPINWNKEWWVKMCDKPIEKRLIIAGALIAAEIDRLQRIN